MAIYTVLAPALRDADPSSAPEPMSYVFVKEGFSWPALFFAAPWLIYRRMWLVLVAYVAVAVFVGAIDSQVGGDLPGFFLIIGHLLFAVEANELRRWTLRRRGYRLVDVVEGHGLEEAEIRFFAGRQPEEAITPVPPSPPAPPAPPVPRLGPVQPSAEAGDVVGLFPPPQPRGGGWS